MLTINTDRLILRSFQHSDADKLQQLLSDPAVMRFSLNGPYPAAKTAALMAHCMQQSALQAPTLLAVVHKQNQQLIGVCGFFQQTILGVKELELGYRFFPSHWGSGFATEAASALKHYAFTELGCTRLISLIANSHHASARVAQKNGFHLEKQLRYDGDKLVGLYAVMRDAAGT